MKPLKPATFKLALFAVIGWGVGLNCALPMAEALENFADSDSSMNIIEGAIIPVEEHVYENFEFRIVNFDKEPWQIIISSSGNITFEGFDNMNGATLGFIQGVYEMMGDGLNDACEAKKDHIEEFWRN